VTAAIRAAPSARAVRRLAASPAFHAQRDSILASTAAFVREVRELAAIPGPTFQERARAEWVADRLSAAGLAGVRIDEGDNVLAVLPGEEPGIVLAAHTDTVFSRDEHRPPMERDGRLLGPGVGDNSVGVAAIIELARRLPALAPRRCVWFAATTGEEGLGDLKGVRRVVDDLADRVGAFVAIEGHFLGRVVTVGVGSRRWRIEFHGPGGHSWHDHGRPSAVAAAATFVSDAACLRLSRRPRTTFNAGRIAGGEGVNVIAREAWVEVDLRSESPFGLERAANQVEGLARAAAAAEGVEVALTLVGYRPAGRLRRGHALARGAAAALRLAGLEPEYVAASTDANYPLSRGIPSVCIGITRGGGMHAPGEWVETEPIARGLVQALALAAALAEAAP
jgi:tripeptide aminopeptidase